MERCDVLIVGGGPAGSSCAWRLRRAGLDVIVLDKSAFPRDKICAGWITPTVVDLLQLDTDEYQCGRVFQPITGFRVSRLGGPEVETTYGRTVSYGIRRCEFDHYLLQRADARCRLGAPLETLERSGDGWCANGEIEAPLVVGAGGHFCPVARMLGKSNAAAERVVAAQEVEFEMSDAQRRECRVAPEVPELYFCGDLLGYGWCFRKGDYLNVGLGREDSHQLSEHVQQFVEQLKQRGRIPPELPGRFRGHAYILYGHAHRERIGDGLVLVGDAAGLAYARSGEGICTAVESGLLAAEAIIGAAGRFGRAELQPYAASLAARLGPPSPAESRWSSGFEPLKVALAGWLLARPWFTRHVVLDRWFLRMNERHTAIGPEAPARDRMTPQSR